MLTGPIDLQVRPASVVESGTCAWSEVDCRATSAATIRSGVWKARISVGGRRGWGSRAKPTALRDEMEWRCAGSFDRVQGTTLNRVRTEPPGAKRLSRRT